MMMEQQKSQHISEDDMYDIAVALSLFDQEKQQNSQLNYEDDLLNIAVALSLDKKEEKELEEEVGVVMTVSRADYFEQSPLLSEEYVIQTNFHYEYQNPSNEDEALPKIYKNYRLVPTFFLETDMWPLSAIYKQQSELRLSMGGRDDVKEWQQGDCESHRCLICLTNVATRFAVPCGHQLCCGVCLPELINKSQFYTVTTSSGQVESTDRRLPLQCFTCRAIIGQIFNPITA